MNKMDDVRHASNVSEARPFSNAKNAIALPEISGSEPRVSGDYTMK
jgi:hypothetical protein